MYREKNRTTHVLVATVLVGEGYKDYLQIRARNWSPPVATAAGL